MPDPLDVLRTPITPVDPDPTFAARLRDRVERALDLPRGVAVSAATVDLDVPTQVGAAIPYLAVTDARRAIDWYVEAFDARLASDPIVMPDGRIGHCELTLGDGVMFLADEHPEIGVVAPAPDGASVSLMLRVPNVDATVATVTATGGTLTREIYEAYGSRNAWVVDPFGHRWGLNTPVLTPPAVRTGDLGYVSLQVPDSGRAAAFYGAVLGWTFGPERPNGDRQVEGQDLSIGLRGGAPEPTLFLCYAVDSPEAAVERVRAAGGTAGEVADTPYGRIADCTDDAGVEFALWQPGPDARRPGASRHGDLGYLTIEAVDSAATRAFYGAVLGWDVTPGRVDDGWSVRDVAPMTGLHGGHERNLAVPMWMVEDVPAAVERVRAAGGTATDPERQPYGLSSTCTDDQGSHFYLGEAASS